jgi:hypothetical protein
MLGVLRIRALPWMVLLNLVILARDRWNRLEAVERRELRTLIAGVARERRVPTRRERELLRRVAGKLDLVAAGRDLMPGGRRRRKR